ncbi:hypothetical protein CWATWH0402_4884 [Crocosphaera watsonii WH 0402]|uniref:Uncharacterized protein n=3 Tax=Crocosphaera watsonii TaxID=263511 RepID=T2JM15_CROWT|nr:hypothetical protein CWATWH0003_5519 [Crocosphaera watsonii WH 0003]CCQ55940.1 hypothetical protein CWATWH0005_5479 [Crocosphaera watsonii WH 0005]CCQ66873.1 hypothetical protein CWATWH0402_4884 [Crocosphaera watsonii WH 0402]
MACSNVGKPVPKNLITVLNEFWRVLKLFLPMVYIYWLIISI